MIDLGLSWLWAALAGAVGLLAVWFGGRRSAKTAANLDAAKETIKAHEVRNEVETDVAAEPDPRKRLRDDWSR